MKRFIDSSFNLFVYGCLLAFTILFWGMIIWGLAWIACAVAKADLPDVYIPQRWTCRTEAPKGEPLRIARGETQVLEITYLSYGQPVNLLSVYDVRLRYRSPDMPAETYHAVAGEVTGTNTVQIIWTPAAEAAAERYIFDVLLQGADSASLKAGGTITLTGHITGTVTNVPAIVTGIFDWGGVQHVNITNAPFANAADLLELWQADAAHTLAISNVTVLVGTGVAGVESNLNEHVAGQVIRDAGQDAAIVVAAAGLTSNLQAQAAGQVIRDAGQDAAIVVAAAGATMGGDTTGQSSNAVVVATRGRTLPLANDVPGHQQAIVWSTNLNRYVHGSVDLSGINASIAILQTNSATVSYVNTEISEVRGLVDGNDHVLALTETFAATNWLQIASNTWQHSRGWMAYNASIVNGDLRLNADVGYMVMGGLTQAVSRIVVSPSSLNWTAMYATNSSGPWFGYDVARANIPATNNFAVKFANTSGSRVDITDINLYRWTFPERVAFTRDFSGLYLLVDTPSGSQIREAANVQYVCNLAASGSLSGTFATGFSVDKFKTTPISTAGLLNGMGMLYYSSVNEFRPVDLANQFELDAAVAPLATIAALNALTSRVSATEAGTSVQLGGDLAGMASSGTVSRLLGRNLPTGPVPAQHSLVMGANGWELKSILASNIVYAVGTNDVSSVPANAAAFYRASYNGGIVGVFVLDQQVVCWFNSDGWTIPHGNLSIYEQLIESNIHLLDGSLVAPALAFASEPGLGISRASSGGQTVIRFGKAGNAVLDIGGTGVKMAAGKTVILADNSRAVSLAEIQSGAAVESDPYSLHRSSTTQSWTHAGGSYTTAQVVATSPLLTNGVASVTWAASGGLQVMAQVSDTSATNWVAFAAASTPAYVRILTYAYLPPPENDPVVISNIVARSWTRPDLYTNIADTAGQIVLVDPAVADRQPVTLAQMQAGLAGVQPQDWSAYPATQHINLQTNMLIMGQGWSISGVGGLGVLSYTNNTDDSLVIAANLLPAIKLTPGYTGCTIATLSVTDCIGTVGVATNGVVSQPMLQWTADLSAINWQTLTPISETYASTNAAGHYEIVAEMPDAGMGFLRAVHASGESRMDVYMPLYVDGKPVETGFVRSGTNLLWVLDGVTNRVVMEAYSE